ncbi:MAG: hypothetical protein AB7Q27_29455, partial [Acidimicrobiia bacterium]
EVDEFQVSVHIDARGRDVLDMSLALRHGVAIAAEAFAHDLGQELRHATGLRFDITVVDPDAVPHFDSPDKKPRRWRDERHVGLAGVSKST